MTGIGDALFARAPEAAVCVTAAGPVSWARFLADVERARPALARHDAVFNMCRGRYDFIVTLVAAGTNGQTTVLPHSAAEGAVAAVRAGWGSALVVESLAQLPEAAALPPSATAPGEVHVYTSGSTGTPVRHVKTFPSLARSGRLAAELVSRAGIDPRGAAVICTTPHQHMYGLEAAIFASLSHGLCLSDATVFHPADLAEALEALRPAGIQDAVLVTSPAHLRLLEPVLPELPGIRCAISATAPLHADLARRIEAAGGPPVFEIYGSTETGSLAWRRTAEGEVWNPLSGAALHRGPAGCFATAEHLDGPVELGDELELRADGRFRLLGRRADVLNIAGKRHSLGALNALLATVTGIADGLFLTEPDSRGDRLTLFLVPADGGDADALRRSVRSQLLKLVDPVFVPRRMILIDRLPRDATGKVSARDGQRLLAEANAGAPRKIV